MNKKFNAISTTVEDPNTDGYGRATRNLFKVLNRLGYSIDNNERQDVYILFHAPNAIRNKCWELDVEGYKGKRVAITMWETSILPKGWNEGLNSCDLIITPSQYCKDIFIGNGVVKPIKVLPMPIQAEDFLFVERDAKKSPFQFCQYANLTKRKGYHLALEAFHKEFERSELVTFKLKSKIGISMYYDDPRLSAICEVWTQEQMTDLLRESDCFVDASMGEGYGMCGMEAMLTGLPTISTYAHALKEHLEERFSYPLKNNTVSECKFEDMHAWREEFSVNDSMGHWVLPSINEIRSKMREAFTYREENLEKGRIASQFIRENYSMEALEPKIKTLFDEVFNG